MEASRAADGSLTMIISGDQEIYAQVKPLLESLGSKIVFTGTRQGTAQLAKVLEAPPLPPHPHLIHQKLQRED